ncbi:type II toxin-antitoxin system RelE/ParE family toxin [Neorhizobium petrolearium]|uniref:Type II toxin-antitoxin system RelE/ParE family toxin n=1 Tax=Neorhizobium petrolearium TaxID=515361 RepID=A0ABY8MCE6_9HYPH|nr:type II toxin-antitoxin system RelE/ParE family toxin [Neorhizobium petrolearium]MCC2613823.1 type II toxin-antitoxin system RelE/ParE family toxin [Neorhizobium petrolearium]WGI72132.1 type II toxin-antitoxin system RelE/ParE family toxin [Neorhizobium petrolearium]
MESLSANYRNPHLRSVIRYTRAQWGAAQVRRYVSGLERGIANLAEGKGPFKDMSALYPALRMARCQHHYVFCLPREDAPALIVAILHERMDLMKRLIDRLNE